MCLILFSFDPAAEYPLVVLANRDEWHERPTLPAGPWEEYPYVVAGRDLQKGGTWMGVTTDGRFAAVTNYRSPEDMQAGERTRGELTVAFLAGKDDVPSYLDRVLSRSAAYAGFNLLVFDGTHMGYLSNRADDGIQSVSAGIHGISNAFLDSDWPKVSGGKKDLRALLETGTPDASWLSIMSDTRRPPDSLLPDTGLGLERERALSPRCIRLPTYGTRCSSFVSIRQDGRIEFEERTLTPEGHNGNTVRLVLGNSESSGR